MWFDTQSLTRAGKLVSPAILLSILVALLFGSFSLILLSSSVGGMAGSDPDRRRRRRRTHDCPAALLNHATLVHGWIGSAA